MKWCIYIAALFFFSCKTNKGVVAPAAGHPDSIFVSLERQPCFGRCPVFKATIYNNGNAVYEGRSSVVRQGYYTGKANPGQIKLIRDKAMELRMDTLQNEYVNPRLADFPGHSFSVLLNDTLRKVHVMDSEPPDAITLFVKVLEEELEKISWEKQETGE